MMVYVIIREGYMGACPYKHEYVDAIYRDRDKAQRYIEESQSPSSEAKMRIDERHLR